MPHPELATIDPFTIDGVDFIDKRTIPGEAQGQANQEMHESLLRDWIGAIDSSRERWGICGADFEKTQRRFDRWEAAVEANPGLTWDEFEQSGQSIESDLDEDPRLPAASVAAQRDDVWIGAVSLLNIRIETDTLAKIEATAYCVPAFSVPEIQNAMTAYGRVYRWVLLNDLMLESGTVLDIVELTFPVDIPEHRFIGREENDLDLLLGEIRDDNFDEVRDERDTRAVRRVRRASAPRRIPVEDRV